jgi:hypothetical protein
MRKIVCKNCKKEMGTASGEGPDLSFGMCAECGHLAANPGAIPNRADLTASQAKAIRIDMTNKLRARLLSEINESNKSEETEVK